jgi:P-type Cu+ transporter
MRVMTRATLPCSACGSPVDPLRASRVGHFGGRFHYFCRPQCRAEFAPPSPQLPRKSSSSARPPPSTWLPPASARAPASAPLPPASVRPAASSVPLPPASMRPYSSSRAPSSKAPATTTPAPPAPEAPVSAASEPPIPETRRAPFSSPPPPATEPIGATSARSPSAVPRPATSRSTPAPPAAVPRSDRPARDSGAAPLPGTAREPSVPAAPRAPGDLAAVEAPAPATGAPAEEQRAPRRLRLRSLWGRPLVAFVAFVAAGLGVAAPGELVTRAAPAAAALGCLLLLATTLRELARVDRIAALWQSIAPLLALGACLLALGGAPATARLVAGVAAIVVLVSVLGAELLARRLGPLRALTARLDEVLSLSGRRVHSGTITEVALGELHPGEEIVVEPGERCPADATIVAGVATVEPWLDSGRRRTQQEGDRLLAGALVVDSPLRAVVRWSAHDRAWARLTRDPRRRADRNSASARLAQRSCTQGAALAAVLGGAIAFGTNQSSAGVLAFAAAAMAAFANVGVRELIAATVAASVHRLLARGVSFRTAEALDQAGQVSSVVFCARSSVLSERLSVNLIEAVGKLDEPEVLRLTAGAARALHGAEGAAVARAAQAHGIQPDRVRSPVQHEGLGVTAVASTGQALMVGSRVLALRQHVSVASRESRLNELEGIGHSVLLTALDGRLVGLVALEEGLQPGARGAVQALLDAGVEPVLLSTASQTTSLALAHSLGVQHVRSEVPPSEQGRELKRLQDSGSLVAAVGRSPADEPALVQADVSIALGGSGMGERWDVDVASGRVEDAALAVCVAREMRRRSTRSLLLVGVPASIALLLTLVGVPPWVSPLLAACGFGAALPRSL